VDRLDYLVLTHPHEDHVGNARQILAQMQVESLLVSGTVTEDLLYTAVMDEARARAVPTTTVAAGNRFSLGGAEVEVLLSGTDDENVNNASIVLRVSFGEQIFLFMGDSEKEAEERLLLIYGAAYLDCDFLKVGHHGSNTSTGDAFLDSMSPDFALISSGKGNSYGHPHGDVLEKLAAAGAKILRVDLSGEILLETDGIKIWEK
jgi:competence protein ComEC